MHRVMVLSLIVGATAMGHWWGFLGAKGSASKIFHHAAEVEGLGIRYRTTLVMIVPWSVPPPPPLTTGPKARVSKDGHHV